MALNFNSHQAPSPCARHCALWTKPAAVGAQTSPHEDMDGGQLAFAQCGYWEGSLAWMAAQGHTAGPSVPGGPPALRLVVPPTSTHRVSPKGSSRSPASRDLVRAWERAETLSQATRIQETAVHK